MFTAKRVSVINKAILTINANLNRAIVAGDLFHDSNAYGWNVEGLRYTTCARGGLSYCLNISMKVRKYRFWRNKRSS